MTVFSFSCATTALGYARKDFLVVQMFKVPLFAATIPISAVMADRRGSRPVLLAATAAILVFGLRLGALVGSGGSLGAYTYMALGWG